MTNRYSIAMGVVAIASIVCYITNLILMSCQGGPS